MFHVNLHIIILSYYYKKSILFYIFLKIFYIISLGGINERTRHSNYNKNIKRFIEWA